MIMKYPFYSVDSTTWMSTARFGEWHSFTNGKFISRRKRDFKFKRHKIKKEDIINIFEDKNVNRFLNGIKVFLKIEKEVTEYWKRKGVCYEEFV